MIVGRIDPGSVPHVLDVDRKITKRIRVPVRCYVPVLRMFIDGFGGGTGQVARPIIYDDDENLVASGQETFVPAGLAADWFDFPFTALPDGAALVPEPGTFWFGLHGGPVGSTIRIYG